MGYVLEEEIQNMKLFKNGNIYEPLHVPGFES